MKYILLLEQSQNRQKLNNFVLEDERNNVAHAMHVLFCTYRLYCTAFKLLTTLLKFSPNCCSKQLTFVISYWMDNYPEDFKTSCSTEQSSLASSCDSNKSQTSSSGSSENKTLIDLLLSLPKVDGVIHRKALLILESKKPLSPQPISTSQVILNDLSFAGSVGAKLG